MSDDVYGDIAEEQKVDVELEGEPAAEVPIRFTGEDLESLLWAIRKLDIGPIDEFVRRTVLSEIERQRTRIEARWSLTQNSDAIVTDLSVEPPMRDGAETIGLSTKVDLMAAAR